MFRVLIADGNPQLRGRMSKLLTQSNPAVEILEARNGAEAVGSAITDRPDVIFMADQMPTMDGATAATILRKKPETRAILLVGMADDWGPQSPISQKLSAFCDYLLPKSLDYTALQTYIQQLPQFSQ
jgi:CheY-like chemotaxis protein